MRIRLLFILPLLIGLAFAPAQADQPIRAPVVVYSGAQAVPAALYSIARPTTAAKRQPREQYAKAGCDALETRLPSCPGNCGPDRRRCSGPRHRYSPSLLWAWIAPASTGWPGHCRPYCRSMPPAWWCRRRTGTIGCYCKTRRSRRSVTGAVSRHRLDGSLRHHDLPRAGGTAGYPGTG